MAIAERTARTRWEGSLNEGTGHIRGNSGALDLPVTWASRTEKPEGRTSPEELAAAAHSSCFSMALALVLGQHELHPDMIDISATVTLDEVDGAPTVTTSRLSVTGAVPGTDAERFAAIVDEAAKICPISRLFSSAEITVEAHYQQG